MDAATISAVAATVSAVAALASLFALGTSVYLQWYASQPRIKVRGTLLTVFRADGEISPTMFGIEVSNVGSVPVTISSVGVKSAAAPNGVLISARTPMGETLPKKLEPQDSVSLTNPLQPIREAPPEPDHLSLGRQHDRRPVLRPGGGRPGRDTRRLTGPIPDVAKAWSWRGLSIETGTRGVHSVKRLATSVSEVDRLALDLRWPAWSPGLGSIGGTGRGDGL